MWGMSILPHYCKGSGSSL
uniref:Uncharacterized protein n=1 Tax=Rhizophora mucronata TaxID=61149 RepID=A0A2P2J5R8_RHIMU